MNAAEKIQAAIDKLQALQVDSSPGPWDGVIAVLSGDGWEAVAPDYPVRAELIVTLHRTIDAQLAILRAGSVWLFEFAAEAPTYPDGRAMGADRMYKITPEGRATLSLADAILGGA